MGQGGRMNIRRCIDKKILLRGVISVETRIQTLQNRLLLNMDKAVLLANKNTTRNKQGYAVLKKDDEWRTEEDGEE